MSAKGRGPARTVPDGLDFYETPAWCVESLVYGPLREWIGERWRVVDAGCGTGAIGLQLRVLTSWYAYGIERSIPRAREAKCRDLDVVEGDFLGWNNTADLVLANPPYRIALTFVEHALTRAPRVAMLLRLPWLASQRRAAWHREHPAHVCVLPRRPSFTGDKHTDATDYAWFIWGCGHEGEWSILSCPDPRLEGGVP